MAKTRTPEQNRDDDFSAIMTGLGEAVAHAEGAPEGARVRVHVPAEVDVRAIRQREGLTQSAFAARYGFSTDAVKQWEQHRRNPEAAARTLLTVIEREPEAVARALAL
ncbi:MAG: helix-turn-helix domain-containing protein [Brevundimonas sp.]